jgi:hypothetical protein
MTMDRCASHRPLWLAVTTASFLFIHPAETLALDYVYHCDADSVAVFQAAADAARKMKNWRSVRIVQRELTIKAILPNVRTFPTPIWIQVHPQNAGSELRLSFEQSMRPLAEPDLRAFMEDFERKQKDRSLHCVSRGTDIGP